MLYLATPCLCMLFAPALATEPLADRIWSHTEEAFVEQEAVIDAVAEADVVLLGEIHDNPWHHRMQARMIRAMSTSHEPGLVLEMLGPQQGDALSQWRTGADPDPGELGPAVGWDESGWPDWTMYQPIAEAALDADLWLYPGAPDRDTLRGVMHAGLDHLSGDRRGELGLDTELPPASRERLIERLESAHCGLGEHAPVDRMTDVQRLRDASMAAALDKARREHGAAMLIAGNGHVRRDFGVPHYLDRIAPEQEILVIGFLPADGMIGPDDDPPGFLAGTRFDFTWFTPGDADLHECPEDD